jgi:hypothetical protein
MSSIDTTQPGCIRRLLRTDRRVAALATPRDVAKRQTPLHNAAREVSSQGGAAWRTKLMRTSVC